MDKKKLESFKKRLETRQQELRRTVIRTQADGRSADEDTAQDIADRAASSYTKEFLFSQSNNERQRRRLQYELDDTNQRSGVSKLGRLSHQDRRLHIRPPRRRPKKLLPLRPIVRLPGLDIKGERCRDCFEWRCVDQ